MKDKFVYLEIYSGKKLISRKKLENYEQATKIRFVGKRKIQR